MFTVRMHRASRRTGSSSSSSAPKSEKLHWQGVHATTHHKVTVCPRTDRRPMVSMFEQGSQICQIHLDTFEGDTETQQKSAFDLMVELAMAYTSDSINKTELLQVRGDKVEALGLGRPKRGRKATASLKRPAAAPPATPSPASPGAVDVADGGLPVAKKTRLAIRREPAAAATRTRPAAAAAKAVHDIVYGVHSHS